MNHTNASATLGGMNCFPTTSFGSGGTVDHGVFRDHLEYQLRARPAGVFVACGTGEFWSLGWDERIAVAETAVGVVDSRHPVVAGWSGSAPADFEALARLADAGVAGLLLMPTAGWPAGPGGLRDYYLRVAERSTVDVILYVKDHLGLPPGWWSSLAMETEALGLKDGTGDFDFVRGLIGSGYPPEQIFNGTPTAEWLGPAYRAFGIHAYSSAILNFAPELAAQMRKALMHNDLEYLAEVGAAFLAPFRDVRRQNASYAISLVKHAVTLRGFDVGRTRPPIESPSPEAADSMAKLLSVADDLVR